MRILHVTECYEGGVRRAMDTIVRLTPEFEHFLLADKYQLEEPGVGYSGVIPMAEGFARRAVQAKSVAMEIKADIIHAHSSWAGAYTRVGTPPKPVVYEPHCFVFDDPERGRMQRWVYRKAERALGKNTAAAIVLTPHEKRLAQGILSDDKIVWLPNVPSISAGHPRELARRRLPEIVMVGRLARQKDPEFFVALYQLLNTMGVNTKFTWIGDGDPEYHNSLTDNGIEVTGWLNDSQLVQRLAGASLYFHSASYEGFPLSVLDAAQSGLPILARDLPCFSGFPVSTATSVQHAADKIVQYLSDDDVQKEYLKKNDELLTMMSPEAQRASLYQAYEMASGTRKEIYDCV